MITSSVWKKGPVLGLLKNKLFPTGKWMLRVESTGIVESLDTFPFPYRLFSAQSCLELGGGPVVQQKQKLDAEKKGTRIAKRIARAGLASRRVAETWIRDGLVSLNGKIVQEPGVLVLPSDDLRVRGKRVGTGSPTQLWMLHKLPNELIARKDEKGRPTIFDRIRRMGLPPTLNPVGRLDYTSEGLLLLTNCGALKRALELPASRVPRRYRLRCHGQLTPQKLRALGRGMTVDGVRYRPVAAAADAPAAAAAAAAAAGQGQGQGGGGGGAGGGGTNNWVRVECSEGKNRQLRKMFAALGLEVNRLIRTGYGPYSLGDLPRGAVRQVPLMGEVQALVQQQMKNSN